jgi:hypothetical protein
VGAQSIHHLSRHDTVLGTAEPAVSVGGRGVAYQVIGAEEDARVRAVAIEKLHLALFALARVELHHVVACLDEVQQLHLRVVAHEPPAAARALADDDGRQLGHALHTTSTPPNQLQGCTTLQHPP